MTHGDVPQCIGVTDKCNSNFDDFKLKSTANFSRKSTLYGSYGSNTQLSNSKTCNSKYSDISVINFFRQLDNVEPVRCRGTIQMAPVVNNNLVANVSFDTKVSYSFVLNYNMQVLTCCEVVENQLGQSHCCVFPCSIVHQVDFLCIESFGASMQCLYLHPASGDNVHGFYTCNTSDGKIGRIFNMPSGMLRVLSHDTCKVMSCTTVYNCFDTDTARIDFENEIKTRQKYGISYTDRLHNIIDQLTTDESDIESARSVDYSDCNIVTEFQVRDEDMTDGHSSSFPNSFTALVGGNDSDDSKVYCDAVIPDKTVGFLNHSVPQFSFTGPDRNPVNITSIDQCLCIADIIAQTGCPNYAQARIPLASGLNIVEWEKELVDYPDKMLIEYLKFGFPLSLSDPGILHNTDSANIQPTIIQPFSIQRQLTITCGKKWHWGL